MLLVPVLMFLIYICVGSDTECPNVTLSENITVKNLRLVQYNVEWLFVDYYSTMNCPGDGCTWKNEIDAKKHMQVVADRVNYLNPDIINFCEIEGCDELNMLNSLLNNSYTPYLKKGTDLGTGQNVGMLTKYNPKINLYRSEERVEYPILGSQCGNYTVSGTTGVSKHYITEFNINGIDIAFIAAHLLAIPTDPNRCIQREAQAQVLQNIIYSYIIDRKYEVIVVGDMNDYDGEILDQNSNKPTSRVLDFIKGLDGNNKGKYELINIAYRLNSKERYSDWWDSDNNCNTSSKNDYSMIDHILVTSSIDKYISNVTIYHGYDEYCGKWDSDHYPVVVDFLF